MALRSGVALVRGGRGASLVRSSAAVFICALAMICCAQGQAPSAPNLRPDPPVKAPPGHDALDTAHMADPDRAAESSPVAPGAHGGSLPLGARLSVTLLQAIGSGSVRNGDTVIGQLAAPVRTTAGATLPAGTRVAATIVSAARAGTVNSGGILSLQLTRVGAFPIISDVRDFNGEEGHKDVADSAPQKGTEAVVPGGTRLEFRVLEQGPATGLVPGVPPAAGVGGAGPAGVPARAGSPNVPSTPSVPPPPRR